MVPLRTPVTLPAPRHPATQCTLADTPTDPPRSTRSTAPPHSPHPAAVSGAGSGDGDVSKGQRHRGSGFVHCHFYGLDPLVGQHVGGDSRGHRLDQVAGIPTDDLSGSLGQRAIVKRRGQLISGRSGAEIHPDCRVDDEVLPVCSLVLVHPVPAMHAQSREGDPVPGAVGAHRGLHFAAPSCQAVATAMASRDDAASCTRTPQTPAAAASADTAAVAMSRSSARRVLPSAAASRAAKNRLRDAPSSTGNPRLVSTFRLPSNAQLCAAVLAKPSPGSSTSAPGSTPASTAASTRTTSSARTSATTS